MDRRGRGQRGGSPSIPRRRAYVSCRRYVSILQSVVNPNQGGTAVMNVYYRPR